MKTTKWFCAALVFLTVPASAAETITYTYDALGRVVTVWHAGTVNNGLTAAYSYDPAANRTQQTVTGSLAAAAPAADTRTANSAAPPSKPPSAR